MQTADIRTQWEGAARGWARWESTIASWMEPATEAMLDMAGIGTGARVLDVASGAGSQTLRAARRVGPGGEVVASDIAEAMLRHVQENARTVGLINVTTLHGAAEELDVGDGSFDAAICRLGLMLFRDPGEALRAVRRALRPGGKFAVVVFTTPEANPFMAKPMQILLRHAGKPPPAPGRPGIFALGGPGVLERLFADSGFTGFEQRRVALALRTRSAERTLEMMKEAFGAYRAVLEDSSETVRTAAWAEVAEALRSFETPDGFAAPAEVLVAAGARPG